MSMDKSCRYIKFKNSCATARDGLLSRVSEKCVIFLSSPIPVSLPSWLRKMPLHDCVEQLKVLFVFWQHKIIAYSIYEI